MLLDYLIIHYQNFGVKICDIWGPYFKLGIWFYAAFKFNFKGGGGVYYKHSTTCIINKCVLYRQLYSITNVYHYYSGYKHFMNSGHERNLSFTKIKSSHQWNILEWDRKSITQNILAWMILIEKYHLGGNARGIQMFNQLYWFWQGEQLPSIRRKHRKLNLLWAMKAHRKGNFYSKYFF